MSFEYIVDAYVCSMFTCGQGYFQEFETGGV